MASVVTTVSDSLCKPFTVYTYASKNAKNLCKKLLLHISCSKFSWLPQIAYHSMSTIIAKFGDAYMDDKRLIVFPYTKEIRRDRLLVDVCCVINLSSNMRFLLEFCCIYEQTRKNVLDNNSNQREAVDFFIARDSKKSP